MPKLHSYVWASIQAEKEIFLAFFLFLHFLRKVFASYERLCVLGDHTTVSFDAVCYITVLLYTVLKNYKYFTASTHYSAGSRRKDYLVGRTKKCGWQRPYPRRYHPHTEIKLTHKAQQYNKFTIDIFKADNKMSIICLLKNR